MWPLLFFSLLAMVFIIERYIALTKAKVNVNEFLTRIRKALLVNRNVKEAIKVCEQYRGPVASVMKAGLLRYGHTRDDIEKTIENAALYELDRLERGLGVLATTANVAPMLGFLGTVTGMIKSFATLASEGLTNPGKHASGDLQRDGQPALRSGRRGPAGLGREASMAIIQGRARKTEAGIFTASMADIVFLLIVFFVLTYNVEVDRTQVKLPKTWVRTDIPKEAAFVSIDESGVIRVSTGKEMSLPVGSDEEVVTFASNVVAADPNKEFVLKADKDTKYEHVDKVLDALKQAKAKVIFLLSEQKTVEDTQ